MTRVCSRTRRATPPDQVGAIAAIVFLFVVAAGAAAGFTGTIALPPLTSLACGAVVVLAAVGVCLPASAPSSRMTVRLGRTVSCRVDRPESSLGQGVPHVA